MCSYFWCAGQDFRPIVSAKPEALLLRFSSARVFRKAGLLVAGVIFDNLFGNFKLRS